MSIIQSGLEGLQSAQSAAEKSAARVANFTLSLGGQPEDLVDISAEAVALSAARTGFEASLRVIETGNQLQESTFDVFA